MLFRAGFGHSSATLADMKSDADWSSTWGSAAREDLLGRLQEQIACGHHTVEALSTAVGKAVPQVAEALASGVSQGLLARAARPDGDRWELTPQGAATLGFRQSVQRATGPGGRVDLGEVAGEMARAAQAAESARRRQQAKDEAHLLVGTPEREAAVSLLEDHYARDTFDLAELERRTTLAMAARTRGDLALATADLATTALAPAPGQAALPSMVTTFSSVSPLLGGSVSALLGRGRFVVLGIVAAVLFLPALLSMLLAVLRTVLGP